MQCGPLSGGSQHPYKPMTPISRRTGLHRFYLTMTITLKNMVTGFNISTSATSNVNSSANFKKKRKKCKASASSKSRTLALEQAYVHDVYSVIASNQTDPNCSPVRLHVKQFLFDEFEPGSVLLDVGCGDGKYLNLNSDIVVVGLDHCSNWFSNSIFKYNEDPKNLVVGNILSLPFREDFFDGILCCSVLHHISTNERRIEALKEIARIMRIGGKLLITVTSGPIDGRDIESQDVLIKVNHRRHYGNDVDYSESDIDSKSYTSTSSSSSDSSVEFNVYKSCTTTRNSSDFENCYSFVKKAFKRFSLTSGVYSMKNSSDIDSKSKFDLSCEDGLYPIELRNLDDDSSSSCSCESSSTTGDSALSSFNRSSSISQTSTSNIFPSSLISVIKEHLTSWKLQLTNNIVWHSLDAKNVMAYSDKNNLGQFRNEQANHRFSLPISFWKINSSDQNNSTKNILNKNKVYASNGMKKPKFQNFSTDDVDKQVEYNLLTDIEKNKSDQARALLSRTKSIDSKNYAELNQKIIYQKSLSSESSRNTSIECSGYKLIAYYSMPELRTVFAQTDFETTRTKMKPREILPITIMQSRNIHQPDKQEMHNTVYSIEEDMSPDPLQEEGITLSGLQIESSVSPIESQLSDVDGSIADEMKENPTTLNQGDTKKFPKKLLRQRSFSADYQPEVVKLQPELPRRFSASPNIGTHRYNSNNHIPHQQQISMDSEESFVTIIPANRSTRDSIDAVNYVDFDFEEEDDDCANLDDISSNETYSYSSDDDDAYCENLSNDERKTSEDTSFSSILEATVRSVTKCDSKDTDNNDMDFHLDSSSSAEEISPVESIQSPPNTLHRYYHLFRNGELEQLIEENVQNLHIIDSFYNEYAMSWCIVAEKIHVWTI